MIDIVPNSNDIVPDFVDIVLENNGIRLCINMVKSVSSMRILLQWNRRKDRLSDAIFSTGKCPKKVREKRKDKTPQCFSVILLHIKDVFSYGSQLTQ